MTDTENSASIIKVLPPEVANKIAAGEVIQRPASIVKELLDNSIDSGADRITITIQNAGRTMIQVSDNGCGMSETDIKLCFLRHATSKLQDIEDLYNIRTLGFRGEAMASVASVSHVTVTTKRLEDNNGIEYEIRGGEENKLDPAATENGTTVTVRNLFYNVPARRAFLKTDATEFRHILLAIQQAAIAYPEISFHVDADGEIIYRLPSDELANRISELFGHTYKASLIPFSEETSLVRMQGYLSDPKLAKKTRGEQFLFVNKRPIMHRHINYIIQEIYRDWIKEGQYPFYALFFEVDPDQVDVNVHPAKQEIKFEDERSISTFTRSVIKKMLNDHMKVPMWDPEREDKWTDRRRFQGGFKSQSSHIPNHITRNLYETIQGHDLSEKIHSEKDNKFVTNEIHAISAGRSSEDIAKQADKGGKQAAGTGFWQIHNQFILSQTRSGIFIMDQHAAHKRIIYEKVLSEADSGLPSTQQLLFPQTVNFSATDFSLLKELHPVITRMGFNVQLLSGNSAMMLGVPSDIRLDNEHHVLESIMEQYKRMAKSITLNEKERIALALANKAAIPRGKRLSPEEMEALVDQLFACNEPFRDPVGKLTVRSLSVEELQNFFY
ncbi:MAG: DNA mismatch repair endonuclease MutL [Balneolales bacterium]